MQALIQQELFLWGIGLVICLVVLVIVLGEIIEKLERRENPISEGLRQIRHVVLPILALLVVLRQVMGFIGSSNGMRMLETLCWVTGIYVVLTLISNVTQWGEMNKQLWLTRIPTLFFALGRAVIVLF